jgi:chaperonin GroES
MAKENPQTKVDLEMMPSDKLIFPTFNKVLVKREEAPEKYGMLFVPESVRDREKPLHGVVAAIGPDVYQVDIGDTVVFGQYSGTNIKVDDMIYVVLKDEDIHVILEEREENAEETANGVSGED